MLRNVLMRAVSRVATSAVKRAENGAPGGARAEGTRWAIAGMATLLTGQKLPALGMFARGVTLLEKDWRQRNPESSGPVDRVQRALRFYESTHKNDKNRVLHVVGIPMIVGGAVGLLASPSFTPPWWVSAGAFALGWQLNIAGHMIFERNKPAFADDPMSFVVGPLWDAKQVLARVRGKKHEPVTA